MCRSLLRAGLVDTARIDVFHAVHFPEFEYRAALPEPLYVAHSSYAHLQAAVRASVEHHHHGTFVFFISPGGGDGSSTVLTPANYNETRFTALICALYP